MTNRMASILVAVLAISSDPAGGQTSPPSMELRTLRVAADPNNLPFSNDRREGFENKIAELIAADLGLPLHIVWHAQRRSFIRETLKAGQCDVVLGMPAGCSRALTTFPYYRSSYVFVQRESSDPPVRSLDDPRLRTRKIGIPLLADDGANTPPAHALSARGIVHNVAGYSLYGDYRTPNPPARLIEAVAQKEIDVAIAWGPLAGYFCRSVPGVAWMLPASESASTEIPFEFSMAMGVRLDDVALRDRLNSVISRRLSDIDRILDGYGIPRLPVAGVGP